MKTAIPLTRRRAAVQDYLSRKEADPKGTSIAQVATEHEMSTASLKRFLRQHRGGPVRPPLPNRGGPQPRLSPEQKERVVELVLQEPTMNLGAISAAVSEEMGFSVSERTIRRCLAEKGLRKQRLRKKALAGEDRSAVDTERRYAKRHRRSPEPRPHRHAYPSDFTDAEWEFIEPMWLEVSPSLPQDDSLRDVLEALRFIGATGIPWRYLPHDFPPHTTVRRWFDHWTRDGSIEKVNDKLRRCLRRRSGAEDTPSVLIIDSQTVKTSEGGEARGYDGGKKIAGRKRHIAVDTLGLPWLVCVHSASVQDRDGAALVIPDDVKQQLPRLELIIADAGYAGRCVRQTEERTGVKMEVVRRKGTYGVWAKDGTLAGSTHKPFQVLPKRWIVERSLAWATKRRRLSRDYERSTSVSEAWLRFAFQHTMVAKAVV